MAIGIFCHLRVMTDSVMTKIDTAGQNRHNRCTHAVANLLGPSATRCTRTLSAYDMEFAARGLLARSGAQFQNPADVWVLVDREHPALILFRNEALNPKAA